MKRLEKSRKPNRKTRMKPEPNRKSRMKPEPQRKSWRRVGVGFASLLIFVIVVCAVGFRDSKIDESPNEIRGEWVTSDPRYQNCTLEITHFRILFRSPHTRMSGNDIREVKRYRDGARSLYEIVYEDVDKQVNRIALYYSRGKGGEVIQIKNQEKMNWTRALLPQGFDAEASG